ncbi:hypothetical protein EKO27_g216 [Xylaria grammica]|uniref:Uncharacterized protein n=1 Tax=Xylaria grammica TaxID=363999 RepID=A0A439DKH0_9PEZI|nr:hypothetical protein EKO27_g216 [Xylaria grammica]
MSEVIEDLKAWGQHFVSREDFEIWQRVTQDLEKITYLKVQLLKDCEAEFSCRTSDQASSRPFEQLPVFQTLEAMLKRASDDLKQQLNVLDNVSNEVTEMFLTRGGYAQTIVDIEFMVHMRKETVRAEQKRMWVIPQAILEHDLLRGVVEEWKNSRNRTLKGLATGQIGEEEEEEEEEDEDE